MNVILWARFSLALLLAVATLLRADRGAVSIQPYANLSLDGWTLLDGGAGSGSRSFGLLDAGLDFVFGENLEGHIGGFVFAGDRDVDNFTGDFGVFSNTITDTRYNVFTAWLQHSFNNSYIRFGQLASDENFYISEGGSLFLNSNFGAIPTVSANVAAPIFSVGAAGLEFRQGLETGYFQVGAYAGDPGPGDRDDHGFKWNAGGDAGYFFIAERGWNLNTIHSIASQVKVGAYYHSGQFDSFADASVRKGNSALYAIIDQPLSESVNLFGRVGYNPHSEYNVIDRYFDIGVNWKGVLGSRPDDTFGVAYSHSRFAKAFRKSVAADANRSIDNEQVLEVTYHAEMAEGWQIQPSLQYIFNPINATDDAIVAGIRLSFAY